MNYTPDGWVIVKINRSDVFYKVFAVWRGGYTTSDSWRMNSGVVSVTEDEEHFYFKGDSGSIYECHKGSYGKLGIYGASVIDSIVESSNGLSERLHDMPDIMSIKW